MEQKEQKTAVISGSRGMDASHLADLLLSKEYKVVAIERRIGSPDYTNVQHLLDKSNYTIEQGDIADSGSISRIVDKYKPNEFYNLAAQSFVGASWNQAAATCDINFTGVCNCLEAIRLFSSNTKFFQASTSEVYGDVITEKQNEDTPARPRSPYAAAKHGAESLVKVYRESYNMFACFARSFNHTGKRRGKEFVTRKISTWIGDAFRKVEDVVLSARPMTRLNTPTPLPAYPYEVFTPTDKAFDMALDKGIIEPLRLGNIDAKRDWTHSKDIVRGMWLMLQQDKPDDYVLASGKAWSVRDYLNAAFNVIGISDWSKFVVIDPKLYRPADVAILCGDATKAKAQLGWEPTITFEQIADEMVRNDTFN